MRLFMLLNQSQQFAIKLNGQVVSKHNSLNEAQTHLIVLQSQQPQYEGASVVVVDNANREMLLG